MPLLSKLEVDGTTLTPLKGNVPTSALNGTGTIPINNTFTQGTYQNYVSDAPNSVDATGNV
jgi:hypothetical protein